MPALHCISNPRHRRVWLLCLLLLLPLVQTATTLHAYSHWFAQESGAGSDADGGKALLHAHCDLCLTAAALVNGAPPSKPPAVAHSTARPQPPNGDAASVWTAPTVTAYESRAPPLASR